MPANKIFSIQMDVNFDVRTIDKFSVHFRAAMTGHNSVIEQAFEYVREKIPKQYPEATGVHAVRVDYDISPEAIQGDLSEGTAYVVHGAVFKY